MKQEFIFESNSQTIRLMPQNYLVAETSRGHIIVDADAAIEDVLAAKIFILLRQHEFKFAKSMDNVLASLNLLLDDKSEIFNVFSIFLCEDSENYPAILSALTKALEDQPEQLIDFIEYRSKDNELTELTVWQKVEMELTVREFCEMIGIN